MKSSIPLVKSWRTRSVPSERQNVNVVSLYTQRAIANFLREVQILISIFQNLMNTIMSRV